MSITASRHHINRALAWSKGQRDEGPVMIDFPFRWEQREGAIFDWYDSRPCHTFSTIQYRKDWDGPFFHEYLLCILANGAVCKFERMGDPDARTEALSDNPSPAYDLAEYFPDGRHALALAQTSSAMVAELTFTKDFDLLDILAICYSIRQIKETRCYTLLRYNCYFLCWTILAVLARRAVTWQESQLRTLNDPDIILDAANKLRGLTQSPWSKASQKSLFIRLCNALGREDFCFAERLIDSWEGTGRDSRHQIDVNRALEGSLWHTSWGKTFSEAHLPSISEAVRKVITSERLSVCGCFDPDLHRSLAGPGAASIYEGTEKTFLLACLGFGFRRLPVIVLSGPAFLHRIHSISVYLSEVSTIYLGLDTAEILYFRRPFLSRYAFPGQPTQYRAARYEPHHFSYAGLKKIFQNIGFQLTAMKYGGNVALRTNLPEFLGNFDAQTREEICDEGAMEALNHLPYSKPTVSEFAYALLRQIERALRGAAGDPSCTCYECRTHELCGMWSRWLFQSVSESLRQPFVKREAGLETESLEVAFCSGQKKKITVAAFQDFIAKRIKHHAVEVFLAVPGRVCVKPDIVLAMTEVWRAMPLGVS